MICKRPNSTVFSDSDKNSVALAARAFIYLIVVSVLGLQLDKMDNFIAIKNSNVTVTKKSNLIKEKVRNIEPKIELQQKNFYDYNKSIAINDFYNEISKSFKPSKQMKKRVSFWFDIYAKYNQEQHIIHHSKYPWLVFDVVDVSSINANKKLHRWTRYHRAKNLVKKRRIEIKKSLKSLSIRKSFRNITSEELRLLKILRKSPGKFRDRLKLASKSIRSQTGQKAFFQEGLNRYGNWIDDIEKIFNHYKLPLELTRIPFVESSYNPKAVSKVGASGVWQIMPAIGKKFLKITKTKDERNDPVKAAKAAALLLKENKLLLKKWPLAVTAYNTGVGMMRKAVRKTKSRKMNDIIKSFKSRGHGFAAKNFYASFLAALHVERYQYLFFTEKKDINQLVQAPENKSKNLKL